MAAEAKRRILEAVAAGSLSPEEAADLLGRDEAGDPRPPEPPPEGAVARVRVEGSMRAVTIAGDSGVHEAVAQGAHTVERRGDVIVIRGTMDEAGGWTFLRGRGRIDLDSKRDRLQVRMNPALPLDVELDAGGLTIEGVHGPINADVSAGGVRIQDIRSPITLHLDAGNANLQGVLAEGDSRIECEAGAVKVHLERGSSVRIRAQASVGKIVLPGGGSHEARRLGGGGETTVGAGAGSLDINVSVGAIKVTADG